MKSHRIVTVAGTVLFGALLLGTPHAAAAEQPRVNPTNVGVPVAERPPSETTPDECEVACEPVDCPEDQLCPAPDDECEPQVCEPVDEPEDPPAERPEEPMDEPTAEPGEDTTGDATGDTTGDTTGEPARPSPSAEPIGQPRAAPAGVPTPTRIDTGEGPGGGPVNWWLIAVSALALLTLAAGGAFGWIARTERSGR